MSFPPALHTRPFGRTRRVAAPLGVALVLGAGLVAVAAACGDGTTITDPQADSGNEGGSVSQAACPTSVPSHGSACVLPEGTTCDFGLCGTRLARCTRGVWQLGSNAPPSPPCPSDPPNPDITCPACWPAEISCTYGSSDCSAPDASLNTAIASCPAGRWVLDIRACRDGGGPDVQGDGGPDAD